MDGSSPDYRREFARSPHHLVLGLLTLGLGFASGNLLPLILGSTLYALGWLHVPDMAFFRRWVDKRGEEQRRAAAEAQVAEFVRRRDALLFGLTAAGRQRYADLALVCRDIEAAGAADGGTSADPAAAPDPRLRKLDELMWTYLRMLGIQESLDRFLETERREDLPQVVSEAEAEAKRLSAEVDALTAKGGGPAVESKQRYLQSRLERLDVLHKRLQRIDQAKENVDLVGAEQERLVEQVKLIRADAVATRNADAMSARIDATVEHLDQTNRWLAEMEEFKDVMSEMPATDARLGYGVPPQPVAGGATSPVPGAATA